MELTAEVLGPLRVVADGTPVDLGGPRQRRLLGVLLCDLGAVVSTDQLVEAVFENDPPEAARVTFRTYVARLRRALEAVGIDGAAVIVTEQPGYRIDPESIACDFVDFADAVSVARDHLDVGEADTAALRADSALGLWRGGAYGEFAEEPWAQAEAIRLEQLRLAARELRAEALIQSGRSDAAIPDLGALIADEPLREQPRRLLMTALYRTGRHAEALRSGKEFRRYLADETGLEPTAELDELSQMIIDRDPRLDAGPRGRPLRGYVLHEPLYEGPLGVTYRASQPSLDRDVAITVIPPDEADDPMFVRRFEVHAQRLASMENPHVAPLYDYWREPGGAYLVSRFLGGGSLDDRLTTDHDMTDEAVERLVSDVGEALAAAHTRGICHGQLTASSVRFDDAGAAYVTEFGVGIDHRRTPDDIAALASIAGSMWRRTARGGPGRAFSAPATATITTNIDAVLGRARDDDRALGFAGVEEFVDAFREAIGGSGGSGDATGADRQRPMVEGPNPYRGLHAFDETDAGVFFGRETLVDDLYDDLTAHGFVAVVGPSGSGKSSTVRAGLIPRLRSEGVLVTTMVPGTRPIAELEVALWRVAAREMPELTTLIADDPAALVPTIRRALPAGEARVVLVVDQLEEAFTLSDPTERELLLSSLRAAIDDPDDVLQVVVTTRSDFLGPVLEDRSIGRLVGERALLVTPMGTTELHEAVVGPAETAGVAVEPALASTLVADATSGPGSLPLLQYALTELYERRVEGTMTLDAYEHLGRLTGVLAQRAEEIHSSLGRDEEELSRRLFSRLVDPGDGAGATRRRAQRTELGGIPDDVLAAYGTARLLTFDRGPAQPRTDGGDRPRGTHRGLAAAAPVGRRRSPGGTTPPPFDSRGERVGGER